MFETYRQLGKQREAELLATAERSRRRTRTRPRNSALGRLAARLERIARAGSRLPADSSLTANDKSRKEQTTHSRKRHPLRWIAVALAFAASAAPAALADISANDRAHFRGPTGFQRFVRPQPHERPRYRSASAVEPRTPSAEVVAQRGAFDWEDAAIGGAFVLVLALSERVATMIAYQRRSTLTTT